MGNILFWDRVSIYSWRYRDKSPLLAHDQHFEGPPKSFPQQLYHVAISSIQHVSQFLHCPQVSLPVSCVILVGVKETPVFNVFSVTGHIEHLVCLLAFCLSSLENYLSSSFADQNYFQSKIYRTRGYHPKRPKGAVQCDVHVTAQQSELLPRTPFIMPDQHCTQ